MEIIPVIDIQGGIVVHAKGGDRRAYPPIESMLTNSTDVKQVIRDFLTFYPFKQFYIADLDAIETGAHHPEYYSALATEFAEQEFWVDAGIKNEMDITLYQNIPSVKPILGSETLASIKVLKELTDTNKFLLSLDKRQGELLGDAELLERPDLWPDKVIAMDIDAVGAAQGPGLEWLYDLLAKRSDVEWYVAGGVRNEMDLTALAELNATGALVASALHTGQIDTQTLKQMEQVHRPS
jgi:phosphoribosylformimino-5-aminoimidazole carboxamide ribotide isomerase